MSELSPAKRRILTALEDIAPSAATAAELGSADRYLEQLRYEEHLVERADVTDRARCWRITDAGRDALRTPADPAPDGAA